MRLKQHMFQYQPSKHVSREQTWLKQTQTYFGSLDDQTQISRSQDIIHRSHDTEESSSTTPVERHFDINWHTDILSSILLLHFFPRSFAPRALSSLPNICWFGMALPDSYSWITWGFSFIIYTGKKGELVSWKLKQKNWTWRSKSISKELNTKSDLWKL